MTEIELFRTTALTLINQNPSTINITKKIYSDDGNGGMTETIINLTNVKATANMGIGIVNGTLTWTAIALGEDGNGITIIQQDPQGIEQELSITVNGKTITINLATDETGEIITIASDIKTAIELDEVASALVTVIYSGSGEGLVRDENAVLTGGVVSESFIGRIYRRRASSPLQIIQPAGTQEREEYSLLAPYDAEIDEPSENVKQTFVVNGETYLITTLLITRRGDEIISKRALLTKVK